MNKCCKVYSATIILKRFHQSNSSPNPYKKYFFNINGITSTFRGFISNFLEIMSVQTNEKKENKKFVKRKWEESNDQEPNEKKSKDNDSFTRKKKVAMMLAYSGKNYYGMQRNPGFPTIEACLFDALVKAQVVRPDQVEQPGPKMAFQRAARTDKGVSAAGQVVSFKMFIDVEDAINKINSYLPDHIKVFGTKRTTKSFDCKNSCSYRTYSYLTPSFAFTPKDQEVKEDYRIPKEVLEQVQHSLTLMCGTNNFHNFTSGKASSDPSAFRYILDFKISEPFVKGPLEYVLIKVKGQSFMLHQIRKMIGLAMAISRGFVQLDYIKQAWMANKLDIPKAPGLGLMLEAVHYDGYDRKYAGDGLHEAIDWSSQQDEIDAFKDKFIYSEIYQTEEAEKSMLKWLDTLHIHSYGLILGHNENRNYHKQLENTETAAKIEEISSSEQNSMIENGKLNTNDSQQEENCTENEEKKEVSPIKEAKSEMKLEEKTEMKLEDTTETKLEEKSEELRQ